MKRLIRFALKQYDVGPWMGAFKNTWSNAAVYLSLFNTAMIVPMAYVTWLSPWLLGIGISVSFGVMLVSLLLGLVVLLLLQYKIFTPSDFSFWSEQWWKHDNPVKDKLEDHDKRFDEQDDRMKRVEKMLEKLVGVNKSND
jgi:succinate dehydrogenase hydrophobic anchor subunit